MSNKYDDHKKKYDKDQKRFCFEKIGQWWNFVFKDTTKQQVIPFKKDGVAWIRLQAEFRGEPLIVEYPYNDQQAKLEALKEKGRQILGKDK